MPRFYPKRFVFKRYRRNNAARMIQRKWRKRYRKKRSVRYQLKKLKRKVYSQLNPGWIDDFTSGTGVTSSGFTTYDWCALEKIAAVGGNCGGTIDVPASPQTRIGNKITVKSLTCRFLFNVSTQDIYNQVRVIIFSVPDPGSVSAAPSDILETLNVQAFYKKNSPVKFKIHKDFTVKLGQYKKTVTTATGALELNGHTYPCFATRNFTIKFPKGLDVWYRNQNCGAAQKNQLGLLLISDSTILPNPSVQLMTRLHFDP